MSRRVDIKNLFLDFGTTRALDGVELQIEPGEFFVLLGPSGCGKTSLLRSIAGLELPHAGVIKLGDDEVTSPQSVVDAIDRKLGFVFQDLALWPHLSAAAHLEFALGGKKSSKAKTQETLDRCHIGHLAKRKPDQLSGGERQRLALARALVTSPDLILMDEPMSSLDPAVARELRALLTELVRDGAMTVIYVTHQQEEAFELADRIAVMQDGKIAQLGTPEEIFARPQSDFVAKFVGSGTVVPAVFRTGQLESALGSFSGLAGISLAEGQSNLGLVFREGMLKIVDGPNDQGVAVTVRRSIFRGDHYLTEVEIDGLSLRARDEQRREVGASGVRLVVSGQPWTLLMTGEES